MSRCPFIKKALADTVNYRADGSYLINLYCCNNTTDALDPNKRITTANGTYTMTAVPNSGCTFAGYYKQNALTTLVTTDAVVKIPVDQSSNLCRHPLFED